jgi:hypothetical protein
MQDLINDELVTEPTFSEVNQEMTNHFCHPQGRDACQKGNKKPMGASVG